MKLTIAQLMVSQIGLAKLAQLPFPAATALKLGRIMRQLDAERESAEKARLAACGAHGLKNEQTGVFDIHPEKKAAFDVEIQALFASEITVHIDPLPLVAIERAEMTVPELMSLEPLLLIETAVPKAEAA